MTTYTRNPDVLDQSDARLVAYGSVVEAAVSAENITADEPVVLLSYRGMLFELNLTGAVLWEALAAPRSTAEMVGVLADAFSLDRDRAERDITDYLAGMRSADLVHEGA